MKPQTTQVEYMNDIVIEKYKGSFVDEFITLDLENQPTYGWEILDEFGVRAMILLTLECDDPSARFHVLAGDEYIGRDKYISLPNPDDARKLKEICKRQSIDGLTIDEVNTINRFCVMDGQTLRLLCNKPHTKARLHVKYKIPKRGTKP